MKHIGICLALILFFFSTCSFAQGRDRGFGKGEHSNKSRHKNFAQNLSEEEKNALKNFKESKEALKQKGQELKRARAELERLISSANSDEGAIRAKLQEVNSAMSEVNRVRVESVLQLKSELSPEKFSKMMQKMKSRMQEKKQGMQGRGGFSDRGGKREMHGQDHRSRQGGFGQRPKHKEKWNRGERF